jgi:hypothetical protein
MLENVKSPASRLNISPEVLNSLVIPESEKLDEEFDKVENDIENLYKTTKEIEDTATRYSGLSSQALMGIAGGVAGGYAGFAMTTLGGAALGGVAIISGPFGIAIGAATAILGIRRFYSLMGQEMNSEKLKYRIRDTEAKTQAIKKSIEGLEDFLFKHKSLIANSKDNVGDAAVNVLWNMRLEQIEKFWRMYGKAVQELKEFEEKQFNKLNPEP